MSVIIDVVSQFNDDGLKRARGELDKLADAQGKTAAKISKVTGAIGAGLLAGAGAAAVGLFQIGSSFDDAFDSIRVSTGATGPALEQLQADMKAVATSVPASFDQSSLAISEFNKRLGLTGQPLQTMSSQVLELSRITNTDLGTNLAAVSSVMQNFGVDASQQSGKLDMLFRASQQSGLSVSDLATQMSGAGVVLRQVGLSFDQSAAFLATLAKAGVDANDVMPALSKTLATAAKDGKNASTVFNETFNSIKNAPSDTAAASTALEVFGAKAGPKLAAMIREGKLSFEDMQKAITNGSDTILGASADTQDFGEKLTTLKNRVFVALEPVASRVFDLIGNAMDVVSEKVGPFVSEVAGGLRALVAAFQAGGDDVTSSGFAGFLEKIGLVARNVFDVALPIVKEIIGGVRAFIATILDGSDDITSSGLAGWFERIGVIARNAFDIIVKALKFLQDRLDIIVPFVVALGAAFLAYKGYLLATEVATKLVAAAQAALNAVMNANPIGLIVVAIAALVAGLVWAYRNVDWFRSFVDSAFSAIAAIISWAW